MSTPDRLESLLVERIDALLPQTQCTKCGFSGCLPYAEAIAQRTAGIDRCPPGGDAGIHKLAALLDLPVVPLDTSRGNHGPLQVALIDEQHCIGCTLCIQACPVDAIVGANKHMHTVVAELCTGCELCVAPCPVDCIDLRPPTPLREWQDRDAAAARTRHHRRSARLARERSDDDERLDAFAGDAPAAEVTTAAAPPDPAQDRKRAILEAALARARARRGA